MHKQYAKRQLAPSILSTASLGRNGTPPDFLTVVGGGKYLGIRSELWWSKKKKKTLAEEMTQPDIEIPIVRCRFGFITNMSSSAEL
ncbi:unnamed protein product [Heligmosomoides polygyrus]|uniref:Uncharacterized protein n=1 Tax=Heligmosomoides polygyrus TaxID=6339 RepID=A0A183GTI8_HELPZ|nr:unnamed protein product [Heligmosomoides polygyrus]